jgi:hypothetical protein
LASLEQRVHHIVIHHPEGARHDHHPTDPGPARDPGPRHQHTSGKIDWFPDNIKGGARKKVLDGLFNRALITTDGTDWFVAAEGYDVLGMPRPDANVGQFEANLDQIIANAEAAQDRRRHRERPPTLEADVAARQERNGRPSRAPATTASRPK